MENMYGYVSKMYTFIQQCEGLGLVIVFQVNMIYFPASLVQ